MANPSEKWLPNKDQVFGIFFFPSTSMDASGMNRAEDPVTGIESCHIIPNQCKIILTAVNTNSDNTT